MSDKIIVALDVPVFDKAVSLAKSLSGTIKYFKIGKELFTACGPDVVKAVGDTGAEVFLDLKFHDIPNTVAKAVESVLKLDAVFLCNVHAAGGSDMMRRAAEAAAGRVKVIAVTVLTSMDEAALSEIGITNPVEEQVLRLARLSKASGLAGVVASAREASLIRNDLGDDFMIVTPGVRPSWSATDDQKRILTPKLAVEAGADYLVIGRPITKADEPLAAAQKIIQETEE